MPRFAAVRMDTPIRTAAMIEEWITSQSREYASSGGIRTKGHGQLNGRTVPLLLKSGAPKASQAQPRGYPSF